MQTRKATYCTPTSEIFDLHVEGYLMNINSPYGDGGSPGSSMTDDPNLTYDI